MGAEAMDLDAFDLFGADVAGDVRTTVDDEHALACVGRLARERRARKPGPYDQIVIRRHAPPLSSGDDPRLQRLQAYPHSFPSANATLGPLRKR